MTSAPHCPHPRTGLVWLKSVSTLYTALSSNVVREICWYLQPFTLLAWVTETTIAAFDFDHMCLLPSSPLSSPIQSDWNSRWCVLDSERLILCGGSNECNSHLVLSEAWKTAYLIHRNGHVRPLPLMQYGHFSCGVVTWKGNPHVFGSFGGYGGNKAENIDINAENWEFSGEMNKTRSSFTPVIWRNSVFLCGGYRNETIETYNGTEFCLLSVKLPEGTNTLVCVIDDSIVILTGNYLTTLSKPTDEFLKTEKKHRTCPLYLYQAPMVFRGAMVNVTEDRVLRYSLETGELLESV